MLTLDVQLTLQLLSAALKSEKLRTKLDDLLLKLENAVL